MDKKNDKMKKAIKDVQDTQFMKEYYDEQWLSYAKKNLHKLSREERMELLLRSK